MSYDSDKTVAQNRRLFSLPGRIGTAFGVAVVGSFVVALLERIATTVMIRGRIGNMPMPFALFIAAVGRVFATYVLLWFPVLCLGAVVVHARRREVAAEPVLVGGFILVAGPAIGIVDLVMVHRDRPLTVG